MLNLYYIYNDWALGPFFFVKKYDSILIGLFTRKGIMYWVTLILGIWIFITPWLLQFADNAAGLWSNVISGIIIIAVSIYGLANTES